jgi:transposase
MPGQAAKVVITEKQQAILLELSQARTESRLVVQRATIVLRAFAGKLNEEVSAEIGLGRHQVGVWRRRWQDAWEELTALECREPRKLRGAIYEVLRDAPRPGSPGKMTAEQVTQILALACEPPEKSGRPISHWTRRELHQEVLQRGIVPQISESQVGRYLQRAALQPHRRKMWLNTTEKDPVVFQQQVEAVCQTYLEAPRRHAEDGTRTVCVDEMTGLQALERAAPDKPLRPASPAKQEFEYIRHGTTTLIGNWDVVAGETLACTLGPTRTEPDLVAHFARTVATDPEVPWVFVVDCLNVHQSAGLVEWVAETCELDQPLGKKKPTGSVEITSHAPGLPVGPRPSHPLRIPAQAQFLAESGRNRIWHRQA